MESLRLILAGSGEFAVAAFAALKALGHRIDRVVTQPDRPAGRGRAATATPVGQWAAGEALALLKTADINRELLPDVDAMVVIAFGQKISPAVVDRPRLGSLNLHASLLPRYRGAAPIHWAILRGERMTGNSVIRLAQRMDAGAIVGQSQLSIAPSETTGELHDRLAADGGPLLARVLDELSTGRATERQQDEALATAAPKLTRADSALDFTRPAIEVAQRICAMSPWPGCHVILTGQDGAAVAKLLLLRAGCEPERPAAAPGVILPGGLVGSGQGAVRILELRPEGGKRMSLEAWSNGHAWQPGMILQAQG